MAKISIKSIICIAHFFLFSCQGNEPEGAVKHSVRADTPETQGKDGKFLYEENCSVCHGSDGAAGIANAANLRISRMDSIDVYVIITNGKSSMPPFQEKLSKEEIKKLRTYVQTLRK